MEKLRMELAAKEKQNKMLEKDLKKLLKSQAKMQKQNDNERLKKLLEVLVAEVRVLPFQFLWSIFSCKHLSCS